MVVSLKALGLTALAGLATAAQYEEYILAPDSRTLHPVSIYKVNGTVDNADSLIEGSGANAVFNGKSAVTLDFGKNIAGLVTLQVGNVDADQYIGVTFSESSLWISGEGSDGTADAGLDETLWFAPSAAGSYSPARQYERGGFRYLSLIHNTTGSLELTEVSVHFTPMPHYADDEIGDYTGYFHCDDELINRIWYAGAYTNQLCTIDPHHGDALKLGAVASLLESLNLTYADLSTLNLTTLTIDPGHGNALVHLGTVLSSQLGNETAPNTWYNNFTITNGTSTLVDGAKRDRLVWAGDMAIAVPAIVVSTNDLISVANALDSLFNIQNSSGLLPYAGIPFRPSVSFTYHLYTLIGVADYYLYSGSLEYLQGKWDSWKLALDWSLSNIDDSGLMNVTASNDWLRFGMGGHNIEANSILYYTINQGIMLGQALNESSSLLANWSTIAETIKKSANSLLWDEAAGLYKDNETTTLHPQDGNCWAIVANLTDSSSKQTQISANLAARWGPYGAPAIEADDAVSPFISGFELQAHLIAGNTSAALDLVRLEWGFMMDDPRMTNSTFIEGYASDGSLHYAPYTNDPRVSHAHGWATGPTSTLTFYIGGIHLTGPSGSTWTLSPRLGDLTFVDTGFETALGSFASQVNASASGDITGFKFTTPAGTSGTVSLPDVSGSLRSENATSIALSNGEASNVPGGTWTLVLAGNGTTNGTYGGGSPTPYTGSSSKGMSWSALALAAGIVAFFF